jgi:hypothetical protein
LNNRQARLNNEHWVRQRELRIEEHIARALAHLRTRGRRKRPGEATNGKRQQVWCVELRKAFGSLSDAGRIVGRAPSNIRQAVRLGVRCGGFHWERYDPARHRAASPGADTSAADSTSKQLDPMRLLAVSLKPLLPVAAVECYVRLALR